MGVCGFQARPEVNGRRDVWIGRIVKRELVDDLRSEDQGDAFSLDLREILGQSGNRGRTGMADGDGFTVQPGVSDGLVESLAN